MREHATIKALESYAFKQQLIPRRMTIDELFVDPERCEERTRMPGPIVDIHPHIVSPDTNAYPLTPLFGIQSDWSKERTASDDQLIAAMDEAGVAKTAIVHASTCYGFDNSWSPTR